MLVTTIFADIVMSDVRLEVSCWVHALE